MDQVIVEKAPESKEIKVYNQRWIILLLGFFYNIVNDIQVTQYTTIAHIISKYYNVTYVSVQWTSLIFLLTAGCLSALGSIIVKKMNLRNTMLLSTGLLCLSSWIRLLSVSPERFWIVMLTQTLSGLSGVMVPVISYILPPSWFGPKELSLSCSILMFGCLIGTSSMSLISQELVHMRNGISGIENGLYALASVSVVASTILLIFMFFFFKANPPTPPTQAQLLKIENCKDMNLKNSFKKMALNLSYWLFLGSYCISIAILNVILSFINRNILNVYPDANMDIGRILTLTNIMGMIGIVASGYLLDKSKHFKAVIIALYACGALSVIAYIFLFNKGIVWNYVISGIFGFFMFTPMSTRYDMSAELCHPVDESVSGSVTVFFTQIVAVVSVYGYSALLDSVGDTMTNLITCGCMIVGCGVLCCVRFDLKRRKVNSKE